MTFSDIYSTITKKKSFLCVGLDSDYDKIPAHLYSCNDPVFEFNKEIIKKTAKYCASYKLNTAFYECRGVVGWESLKKTADFIKQNYPEIFLIADAKRGDIGNTSTMYAKTFFENMPFDAVTVAPYMGSDSIKPFLAYKNKFVIVLALTSNTGAADYQFVEDKNTGEYLYEKVLKTTQKLGSFDNMMYVIGATKAEQLKSIRKIIPEHFLLVPGVGAQGGSLSEVVKNGMNETCGLLINSSRGIIFSDSTENFASEAEKQSEILAKEMSAFL